MKILMLVNWKVQYTSKVPEGVQPPDYYVEGEPYWFFRYFEDKDTEVDVVDISSFPALERFEKEKIRFYIRQTLKVLPKLKNYDVVLSHGMQSGIVLCFLRKLFGKGDYKHIVFDIGAFNSAKESGRALRFMQYAGRSLDGVIYHTPAQIDYYRKCHPWLTKKAFFIPFGTDTEFFDPEIIEQKKTEKPFILCIGYNKRDWKTLIDAYLMTDRSIPLRIIGNKDVEKYVDEKGFDETGKNNIVVLDKVSIEELKMQIANAAFCVLPLKNFNYSFGQMTMLQQMAMGKAVVAADVPSLRPYFVEGANIKYESENKEQLSKIIETLMHDKELCESLGQKAKVVVKEQFNEQIMAGKIEDTIKYICRK
ncbi:MAG: glycosyltransferase family 4 protein [Lachnospiraceae bacterium]|nr:glycosyltransferase family 4 protein [Lachnospiraceae bacterium]